MLKELIKIKQDYDEAKETITHNVIDNFESKKSKLIVKVLFIFLVLQWAFALFTSKTLEQLSDTFGEAPFAFPFLTSYFFFFLGSKFVFKPTSEEIEDDTSSIALFSACDRKKNRSVYSLIASFFQTLIFVCYLFIKDLDLYIY
jgi:hypothetical protein